MANTKTTKSKNTNSKKVKTDNDTSNTGAKVVISIILILGSILYYNFGHKRFSLPKEVQGRYVGNLYEKDSYTGLGIYYVYDIKGKSFRLKLCKIGNIRPASYCDFDDKALGLYETIDYKVKNIETNSAGTMFDVYKNDSKEYECKSSFGSLICSTSTGGIISLNKAK